MADVEVELTERGIRAVDAAKTSITVIAEEWTPDARAVPLAVDVDATVAGYTRQLRFPMAFVRVTDANTGAEVLSFGNETGPVELPEGEYLASLDSNVQAYARFRGPATLAKPNHEGTYITFPREIPVTLGFQSRVESPPETITVPGTPDGMARALSHLPVSHRTATADRSFPTMRGHPPRIEVGDTFDIPSDVTERTTDPNVEFVLPSSFEYLYPAAPLSYYLGADVTLEPNATPRLTLGDRTHAFDPLPTFQIEVADLLRRTFLLDCLVRNAGPNGVNLHERRYLDDLSLDPTTLYGKAIPQRMTAYLDAPFERISDVLPDWHLSMSVAPTSDNLSTLPYLLSNLANIVLADSTPLDQNERLSRSLNDFYRDRQKTDAVDPSTRASSGETASVELVEPRLGPGRVHGWLAEGTPIDVFKAVPEAYENRFTYRERASEPLSIVAVLNDTEMATEHTEAARIYRDRATELDIDITIHEHLTQAELADVFESRNDLIHYIGHCDESGLRCADGHLDVNSLSASNAQVFFLNACGSYHQGIELVRKGSVAGAVTFNKVLDEQAARVGTMFARLLVNGFSIEQALQLARRRIMMGKDYTVVGDGTHVLAQSSSYLPAVAEIDSLSDGMYRLQFQVSLPWLNGGHFEPHVLDNDEWYLFGSNPSFVLSGPQVATTLGHTDVPVIYDGDIHWSDDLHDQFA